jgi:hypothetical protein
VSERETERVLLYLFFIIRKAVSHLIILREEGYLDQLKNCIDSSRLVLLRTCNCWMLHSAQQHTGRNACKSITTIDSTFAVNVVGDEVNAV